MATAGPSVRAGLHTASSGGDDALAILSTALAEQGSTSAIAVARERLTGVIRQETVSRQTNPSADLLEYPCGGGDISCGSHF